MKIVFGKTEKEIETKRKFLHENVIYLFSNNHKIA
jgi:hypothetical protein